MATSSKARKIPMMAIPIAPSAGFTEVPVIRMQSTNDTSTTTTNFDLQPPQGQTWALDLATVECTVFSSPEPGKKLVLRIYVTNDGGTTFSEIKATKIAQGTTFNEGSVTISLGGQGSAFDMNNQQYVRLSATGNNTAAGGQFAVDFTAFMRRV